MAGKSQYTDDNRNTVFIALAANDGNVKRTSRETGFPESTVRRWKKEFEAHPPDPEAIKATVESGAYVETLRSARDEALAHLRKKIPEASARDLGTIYGILEDKLTRIEGLNRDNEHHHFHHLPPAAEVAELLTGLSANAITDSRRREAELTDTNLREQLALPAPRLPGS